MLVAIKFQGVAAPGEEIVPPNEPVVKPVTWLNKRSTVKPPVASTNRPVPLVIVAVSTTERTPGDVRIACPVKPAVSVSPLAAVNSYVPVEVLFVGFTTCGISTVNRPRCVAFPAPAIETDRNGGVPGVMVAVPSNLPLNGTSWSLERTPAPVGFASDDAIARLADDRDVGLVGVMG